MDLSKLSDADLLALQSGDLTKVSDAGLKSLQGQPAPAPESPTSAKNMLGAAIEPAAAILTGTVAQPVAGLAGILSAATSGSDAGADTVRRITDALTYAPRTVGGKNAAKAISAPFELVSDLARGAGEKAADATGSPAIGAAVDTAVNIAPAALGIKGPSVGGSVTGAASRRLMQSALKPSVNDTNVKGAIQTLLDEGINVTPGGARKMEGAVASVNDRIAEAIANSTARVDKNAVAGRLQDVTNRVERQVNPAADVATVERVWNEFLDHPLIPGADMPVQLAQELKQGTYKQLRDKYGEIGSAETEAQKALARGLKEEVATAVPEVGPLNARESNLLNAKNMLDRRVLVSGNANPVGIGGLSSNPLQFAGMMLDRSELIKSLLARALNPGKRVPGDQSVLAATGPQSFSEDQQRRKAVIDALLRGAQ